MTGAPMVEATGVHKQYGGNLVIRGIDLTVAPGEVTCLLGPSGSGKSTFLRCINHLEKIDAGTISVAGELVGYRRHNGRLHELRDAFQIGRFIGRLVHAVAEQRFLPTGPREYAERLAGAVRRGHQQFLMVAAQAVHIVAGRAQCHHPFDHPTRFGSAIDQVAEKHQHRPPPAAHRIGIDLRQQVVEAIEPPMHVTDRIDDDIVGHARCGGCGPAK